MKPSKEKAVVLAAFSAFIILLTMTLNSTESGESPSEGFEDISDKIENNKPLRRYGAVTFSHKDSQHVFVTGYSGQNQLFTWKNGELKDVTPEELKDEEVFAIGAAACDIDSDSREELYVLTTGNQFGGSKETRDRLYSFDGEEWNDKLEESEVVNQYSGRSVGCVHTPKGYGFFVARYGGPMQLITEENESLKDVASEYRMDRVSGGRSVITVPSDDGTDLFVGNERGRNYYYERTKNGFEEKAEQLGLANPEKPARGGSLLDIRGNGKFDLALGNWEEEHQIFERKNQSFQDIAPEEFSQPTRIRSVIARDFDLDGKQEIFMNNIASPRLKQPNTLHTSKGERIDVGDASEPWGYGTGATVGDFNSDGNTELLVSRGEQGAQKLRLYTYPSESRNIRIMPVWKSGAPARGSKVVLESTGRAFNVDGGSAYLNQMSPYATFGAELPVNVTVTFPDGKKVEKTLKQPKAEIHHPDF